MRNDWSKVRRELDKSDNFEAICNSPWYTNAVYQKFSDAEFERRNAGGGAQNGGERFQEARRPVPAYHGSFARSPERRQDG